MRLIKSKIIWQHIYSTLVIVYIFFPLGGSVCTFVMWKIKRLFFFHTVDPLTCVLKRFWTDLTNVSLHSYVLPALRTRRHLHALEQVSVSPWLDRCWLSHRYAQQSVGHVHELLPEEMFPTSPLRQLLAQAFVAVTCITRALMSIENYQKHYILCMIFFPPISFFQYENRIFFNFQSVHVCVGVRVRLLAVCDLPCANNGRCVGPNTCQCPSDYTGPQCLSREYLQHIRLLLHLQRHGLPRLLFSALCTPACQNGGRCVDVNKCTCVGGWKGARCQIGVFFRLCAVETNGKKTI